MTFWTDDSAKVKYAKEYFSSFNSMTSRIIEAETKVVKSFSKNKWDKLPVLEKERVINNSLIFPGVVKRYKSINSEKLPEQYQNIFPKLIVTTGQRSVSHLDDDVPQSKWKDEHSDPFSWETKSQMNISMPPPAVKPLKKQSEKKQSFHSNIKLEEQSKTSFNNTELVLENVKSVVDIKKSSKNKLPVVDKQNAKASQSIYNDVGNADSSKQQSTEAEHRTSLKNSSEQPNDSFYKLPQKEVKRRPESKKTKSSTRINPRSSITLDGGFTSVDEESGAIRNLEKAMREEQDGKADVKSPSHEKLPTANSDNMKDDHNAADNSPSLDDKLESFLLQDESSLAASLKLEENEQDESVQKSGFDFLDNW